MFYLYDGSIGASVEDVLHDFRVVEEVAADLGLSLNRKKTELICDVETTCEAFLSKVPGRYAIAKLPYLALGNIYSLSGQHYAAEICSITVIGRETRPVAGA